VRVVALGELDEIPVGERGLLWRPLRHALGIEAFGINAEHLERSVADDPRLRRHAQADPDLAAIRSDPRFPRAA